MDLLAFEQQLDDCQEIDFYAEYENEESDIEDADFDSVETDDFSVLLD